MKRWFLRDRFTRYSLVAIGGVVILSLVFGFLLDWKGFLEGVLASLAFSGITIIIGLFFVDRLIEHRQEQQWARVRLLTYRGLAAHLCDVVAQTDVVFTLGNAGDGLWQMLKGRNNPEEKAIAGFAMLAAAAHKANEPSSASRQSNSDRAVVYYETVKWELEQIQTILTPCLLQSATDQRLVEALMEFDHANRTLYTAILGHKQAGTQSAYLQVPELIVAAKHLYRELLPHWAEAERLLVMKKPHKKK